jgi:putative DNA methylase
VSVPVTPFALKDAPALIERLLPVQKLSAEAYKEQMAVQGKTLTALGSYWKGRKPLDPQQGLHSRLSAAGH